MHTVHDLCLYVSFFVSLDELVGLIIARPRQLGMQHSRLEDLQQPGSACPGPPAARQPAL